jgi:hypothetical protein
MKPFNKNPKQGVLLATGISILFGCLIFVLLLLLTAPLGGCAGASPIMMMTEVEPTGSAPLATKGPSSQATQAPRPTAPVVRTPLPTAAPALPEKRLVSVEYPKTLRPGDGDIIKLSIELDDRGLVTPTAEIAGHQLKSSSVEIPNLYETHQIIAEARLDLAGIEVHPEESFTTAMLPGKPVVFYWSITAPDSGVFRGTLWLYLNLIPNNGEKPIRLTLLAQRIDVEATSLLGMSGSSARWIGAGGSALSFVFGIPFLETVISRTWKRLRRVRLSSGSTAQGVTPPNREKITRPQKPVNPGVNQPHDHPPGD